MHAKEAACFWRAGDGAGVCTDSGWRWQCEGNRDVDFRHLLMSL